MYFRYPFFLAFGFGFVVTILIGNSLVSIVVLVLFLFFFRLLTRTALPQLLILYHSI